MEIKAQHRNARMSARKLRLMRSIVRGLSAAEAQAQLQFMPGKAAEIVQAVLKSAVANADHNYGVTADKLRVTELIIDEAFKMKRFRAGSRGTAKPIRKHTAHVTVIVEETGEVKSKKRRAKKTEIKTITPADFVKQVAELSEEEKKEEGANRPEKTSTTLQKTKINQKGGDAKKEYRRKSISGE